MADNVRNRVRLPGPRGTLNGDAGRPLHLLDDSHLLMVIRQREEEFLDIALTITARRARQPAEVDGFVGPRFVGRWRHQGLRPSWNFYTRNQLRIEAFNVFMQIIVCARS
jgi:hypothetical protein